MDKACCKLLIKGQGMRHSKTKLFHVLKIGGMSLNYRCQSFGPKPMVIFGVQVHGIPTRRKMPHMTTSVRPSVTQVHPAKILREF